jgi:uncharacterized protein
MQNPFVWHDLATTDVEAAKAFYQKVVGWTFSRQSPEYEVALVGEVGVGGIMELPPHLKGMPPFWSGYVFTPDVDAAWTGSTRRRTAFVKRGARLSWGRIKCREDNGFFRA